MNIVAIIEARMTSSRLPGKVLLPVCGKPILSYLIERLKLVKSINEIVLATTINPTDDILVEFAQNLGIACFRGSENDVMQRVLDASKNSNADVIVEITGDCPIIDPSIIEQSIQIFLHNDTDYVSNASVRSYPDGMDTQVYWAKVLQKSFEMTDDRLDHEHVTLHIRNNPQLFSLIHLIAPPELNWPELGLTLDEKSDYILLKKLIAHFEEGMYPFSCLEAVNFLKANPELLTINSEVIRKGNN